MRNKITGSFRQNRRKAALLLASGAAAWGLGNPMMRVGSAQGATDNWNGADPSYSGTSWYWSADGAGGNWTGSTPANGDSLVFAGTVGLTNYNDLLTSASEITFNSGSGAFDLLGNALSITGGTVVSDQDTTAVETIGINLTGVSGITQAFTVANGATLTIDGNLSRTNTVIGNNTVNVAPASYTTAAPVLNFGGTVTIVDPTLTNDGQAQGNGVGWTQRENTITNLLSGATFIKTGGFFNIGQNGDVATAGTFNVEGGSTLSVGSTSSFNLGFDYNHAGNPAEAGVLNVSGTAIATLPSADPANTALPASADAEGYIRFGVTTEAAYTGAGTGTINLLPGGVLETSRQFVVGGSFYNAASITVAAAQTGYLNFRGGTLETDGTNSVSNWFPASSTIAGGAPANYDALTGIYISGPGDPLGSGAFINTNGVNATIGQPLADNPSAGYAGGALTKQGFGVLTLAGTNSYTGATTISAGKLDVTGSLAAASAVTVNGGTALGGNGNGTTTGIVYGPVSIVGGNSTATSGAIDLTADGVNAVLTLNGGLALGTGPGIGGTSRALLNLDANATTSSLISLGSGSLTLAGTALISITSSGVVANQTYTLLSSTGALGLAIGSGTTTLDGFTLGAGSFGLGINASLNITANAVQMVTTGSAAPAAAYWSGAQGTTWAANNGSHGNFTTNGATDVGTNEVTAYPAAATHVYFSTSGATNLGSVTLGASFDIGTLTFLASTPAVTVAPDGNTLTLEAGGIVVQSGAGAIALNPSIALDAPQTWTNAGTNTFSVGGTISGTAAAYGITIHNTSTGVTIFAGTNTYAGGTTISAGTLQMSGNSTSGASGGLGTTSGALILATGGALDLNGTSQSVGTLAADSTTIIVSNNAAGTLSVGTGVTGTSSFLGTLTNGTGTLALTKAGTGVFALAGTETYGGQTSLNGGVVQISGAANLGNASATNTISFGGGALESMANSYTLAQNVALPGAGTIQVDAGTLTESGTIIGTGGLTKTGTGALILTLPGTTNSIGGLTTHAGTLNIAGTTTDTATVIIGDVANSVGTMNVGSTASVIDNVAGAFNQVGNVGTTVGVLNNAGTLSQNGIGGELVADGTNASGAIYNSGTFSATALTNNFDLGDGSNAYGYLNNSGTLTISGSSLTTGALGLGWSVAGGGGSGVVDVTGGTLSVANANRLFINSNVAGTAGQETAQLNVTGGNFVVGAGTIGTVPVNLFANPYASINVSGSGVFTTVGASGINLNAGTFATGGSDNEVANLTLFNGGTLKTSFIESTSAGNNESQVLSFNGGNLTATAGGTLLTSSGADGGVTALVESGGGTISNGGFTTTITAPLIAPTADGASTFGVKTITLTSPLSGYIGAPVVEIADADLNGSGATAIANFNPATGQVTSITVTSPGTAYMAPTVYLVGGQGTLGAGAGSIALAGTISTGSLTSGGITFAGSGTTILSSLSTYAGPTAVIGGTLDLTGVLANSGTIGVAAPATLLVDGPGALLTTAAITSSGTTNFTNNSGTSTIASLAGTGTLLVGSTATLNVTSSLNQGQVLSNGSVNVSAGANIVGIGNGVGTGAGGSLTTGGIDGTGTLSVTTSSLTAAHVRQSVLNIASTSKVTIADSAAPGNTSATSVVTDIYNSGTLDLKNNDLIVLDTTQYSTVKSLINSAADGGNWDQSGITSSSAKANSGQYGLGYAQASTIGSTSFDGQTFTDAVLVKYTLLGDTQLRGAVGIGDYDTVLNNFGTGTDWYQGNFHYSGTVGIGDYDDVLNNFGAPIGGNVTVGNALTRGLSPALSVNPNFAKADLKLEVNTVTGDVYVLASTSVGFSGYTIADPSAHLLDGGSPDTAKLLSVSGANGGNTNVYETAGTYVNWNKITEVANQIAEGQNNNGYANHSSRDDTVNIPAGGTIDFGDIYNTTAGVQDITFNFAEAGSNGNPTAGPAYYGAEVDYVTTPEPASVSLLAIGMGSMLARRRRSRA